MTDSILVDTDVLIDFFRGYEKAVFFIHENSERMILSSIVIAELYAGVKGKSERTINGDGRRSALSAFSVPADWSTPKRTIEDKSEVAIMS